MNIGNKRKIFVIIIISLFFIEAAQIGLSSTNNTTPRSDQSTGTQTVFNPFKEGWAYRKKITIDHTKVSGDLINFPVLISITDTNLKTKAQSDGDDILFMNDKGTATQLAHEIERYDPSTGNLIAWINLPSVSSSHNTIFYMYYGNPSCESQQKPRDTWNSNFISVWHFNQESGLAYDSKGQYNGTASAGVTQGLPGIIDGAFGFDGTTGYVDFGEINKDMYAISFWVKPVDTITPESPAIGMLHLARTSITRYGASFGNSGDTVDNETIMIWCGIPEYRTAVTDLIISNTMFHLIVFNWNATANRYDIYFDGIQEPVVFGSEGHIPLITVKDFGIGHEYQGGHGLFYHGIVDEARLLSASLSPEWISTELTNQNDPSGFYSFDTEVFSYTYHGFHFLEVLFERFPHLFPLLRYLLE